MYSRNVEDFVAFGPWLIASVPLHHGGSDYTCSTHKQRHKQGDGAENSMRSKLLLPVSVGVNLYASANCESSDDKTKDIVAMMHQVPSSLEISFRGNQCVAKGEPGYKTDPSMNLVCLDSCIVEGRLGLFSKGGR